MRSLQVENFKKKFLNFPNINCSVIGNEECDEGKQIWTSTLRYYTTYKREDVLPVVHEIASIVLEAEKSKYQAVRKKYTLTKHMRVSLRTELKSPTMIALAKKKQA